MLAAACACQAVWMGRILEKLNHAQDGCTTLMCDNSSTIKLSKKSYYAWTQQTH
jgi:hypothetical protein